MRKISLIVEYPDSGLDGLKCSDPSLCQSQFEDECNLRLIVQRFLKTGEFPQVSGRQPLPKGVDATQLPQTFEEVMDRSARVRQAFDLLPLETRNEFNNDPEAWLDYLSKEERKALETTDPATTDPATAGPATADPATTDPATTDPATAS